MYIILLSYSHRIIRFFSSLLSVPFRIPEIQTKFKFRIKTLNLIYYGPNTKQLSQSWETALIVITNTKIGDLRKPYPAQNFTIKFNKTNSNNNQPANSKCPSNNTKNSNNSIIKGRNNNKRSEIGHERTRTGPAETEVFVGDFSPYFSTTADMKNFKNTALKYLKSMVYTPSNT